MKMSAFAFLLIAISSWLDASELKLAGSLVPDRVLPGIPVNVRLIVTNPTDRDLELPLRFVLQVIPEQGDPFLAEPVERTVVGLIPEPYRDNRVVKNWQRREFFVPLGYSVGAPGAFGDRRLAKPGKYRFQLLFHDELSDMTVSGVGIYDRTGGTGAPVEPLGTNEMVLEIEEPSGVEAEVWNRIGELTNNAGLGNVLVRRKMTIAKEVWSNYPPNRYSVQVGVSLNLPTDEEKRKVWSQLIAMDEIGLISDRLRITLADLDELAAMNELMRGDQNSAAQKVQAAQETLHRVIANPRTPLGKLEAERKLHRLHEVHPRGWIEQKH